MGKIIYTHDTGVVIEVGRRFQQVIVGNVTLGPFEPFDVVETVHALGQHVRATEDLSALEAAMDWQRINECTELLEDRDDKPLKEPKYRFKWETTGYDQSHDA